MPNPPADKTKWFYRAWLLIAIAGYLALALWQLGLPGLHYDEAREAGVNAMELLTGAPLTAFRGAAFHLGNLDLPLMVQDYIGALNVYLALPFLGISGIGVPNLRLLSVLVGLLTLVVLERAVGEWLATHNDTTLSGAENRNLPLTLGGLSALTLAAFSPAFVFWSRQGIFVTNSMTLATIASLWMGVRWLRTGSRGAFVACAFLSGVALYAKLLALWVLLPFALLLAMGYWRQVRRANQTGIATAKLTWTTLAWSALAFLLPLIPLLLFNLQTLGTWDALTGNIGRSYYGVDNANLLGNLGVRLPQIKQVLESSFLWYLGGIAANPFAPWAAAGVIVAGMVRDWRMVLPPLLLAIAAFALSLITISDLFITHYALLHLVLLGVVGIAIGAIATPAKTGTTSPRLATTIVGVVVVLWALMDVRATVTYHQLLAQSGGLADHSDASYDLAYHLRYNGMGAPVALDWGMDAPVRFLTEGTVTPIEIFGYESPSAPDAAFNERLAQFAANPDNVYLLHAPDAEVFAGRRTAFDALAAELGSTPRLEATFAQRDGTPLYEIWRLEPSAP